MKTSGETRFTRLITPYIIDMVRVASVLVGYAYAEDAAQEALVRAWQSLATLNDETVIRAWLLRITINLCHDWQRGRFGTIQRTTQSFDEGISENPNLKITDKSEPGSSNHSGLLDLRSAVQELPPDLRLIVVLRYYVDLDATEIGATLNIPPSTVRTRLSQAVKKLRVVLIEQDVSI